MSHTPHSPNVNRNAGVSPHPSDTPTNTNSNDGVRGRQRGRGRGNNNVGGFRGNTDDLAGHVFHVDTSADDFV